ncbi:hypothetical protein [Mycobacterium marinum]|uniref:hypothetical protein n=1 Tax=Mycobacterium marinum TaxID=1781 RepID=UPI000E28B700|nr:hypothetical protein [Mycobacterium marinum]
MLVEVTIPSGQRFPRQFQSAVNGVFIGGAPRGMPQEGLVLEQRDNAIGSAAPIGDSFGYAA